MKMKKVRSLNQVKRGQVALNPVVKIQKKEILRNLKMKKINLGLRVRKRPKRVVRHRNHRSRRNPKNNICLIK